MLVTTILAFCMVAMPSVAEEYDQSVYDEIYGELRGRLAQEKGPYFFWSIEDKYEWQQKHFEIIKHRETQILGLPSEDDLQQEEAYAIALEAVQRKYGVVGFEPVPRDEDAWLEVLFVVNDPEAPYWRFCWRDCDLGDGVGYYIAVVDARDGSIIELMGSQNALG